MLIFWTAQYGLAPIYGIDWTASSGPPIPPPSGSTVPEQHLILGQYGTGVSIKIGGN